MLRKRRFRLGVIPFLEFLLSLAAGRLAAGQVAGKSVPSPIHPRPSLVLITLDTVRADRLGCYGYPRAETPALDGLARDAVRFENAYTVVPITLPSHAVMLTGTYPIWNGVRDFTSAGLPSRIPTLAEALRHHGYATAAFVSSFVLNSMWGLNRGFEVYDDEITPGTARGNDLFLVMRPGNVTTDRMLAWLNGNTQKPFFVWLHLYDAHSPYRAPQPYRSRHTGRPYDGAIAFDDAQVGRVLDALRQRGLYDRTLIIVASDHGESLGEHGEAEHGFFIYNATLCVPLLVKWPLQSDRGRVVSDPVSTIDIAPTLAQASELPTAEDRIFQGQPLSRWMAARTPPPEPVYAESYYACNSFGWHELRGLVTPKLKYVDAPEPELYDLARDPSESSNVIATHQAEAAALHAQLEGVERKFEGVAASAPEARLDPETIEKLKSLGYVAYEAGSRPDSEATPRADPKQKIATFNQILREGDLRRSGKYAEAAQLLAELSAREPKLYVIPFEAGENDLAWGKPQEGIREFRAALQLNPVFDQALLGLGRACFETGQDTEAATALQLALHLNPRNSLARLGVAKVYVRLAALDKAEAELARVVSEQPGYAEAHADYGVVLARRMKYAEAEKELELGLKLGYRDAATLNFLGIARAQLGKPKAALDAYQEAIQIDPRYAPAYLNLALEYRRLGQPTEALRCYRKVCELSDQFCRQYQAQFPER